MRLKSYYLPLILVATLLGGLLLAACGDGDEKEAEAPPAAAETAEAPEEAEAPPAATEIAEEPEDAPAPTDAFADLESYRYSLRISFEGEELAEEGLGALSFDMTGAFVAPDRSRVRIEGDIGGFTLEEESISIGDRTWVLTGDTWREGEGSFESGELAPNTFFSDFDVEKLTVIKPSEETVNGVDSLRYSIDEADIEQLEALAAVFGDGDALEELPEDFTLELWLAKDGGWPVKMVMTARGPVDGGDFDVEMTMDITDVNDPDIEIEPPI
jgi:hypothetical protein